MDKNTIMVNLHWHIYIYTPIQSTIFSSPTTLASHDFSHTTGRLVFGPFKQPPGGPTPSDLQQISANGIIIIATPQVQREMFNTALQRAAWKTMVQNMKKNPTEDQGGVPGEIREALRNIGFWYRWPLDFSPKKKTRTHEISIKDGVLEG